MTLTPEHLHEIAAVITAIGVPIVAYFTYLGLVRTKANAEGIERVHKIVNGQNTDLVEENKRQDEKIAQLTEALSKAGIKVPD